MKSYRIPLLIILAVVIQQFYGLSDHHFFILVGFLLIVGVIFVGKTHTDQIGAQEGTEKIIDAVKEKLTKKEITNETNNNAVIKEGEKDVSKNSGSGFRPPQGVE